VTECRCLKKREGDRDEHSASVSRGARVGLPQATSVTSDTIGLAPMRTHTRQRWVGRENTSRCDLVRQRTQMTRWDPCIGNPQPSTGSDGWAHVPWSRLGHRSRRRASGIGDVRSADHEYEALCSPLLQERAGTHRAQGTKNRARNTMPTPHAAPPDTTPSRRCRGAQHAGRVGAPGCASASLPPSP
jgi:hypothetical protein